MLKKRASGKLRKNKANSWMKKYRNRQKPAWEKKRRAWNLRSKRRPPGKKDYRKKEKESLKPTKHEKAAGMEQESTGRKKEKWLRPTENKEGKTQASYHQYFIYLHYHVYKHLYPHINKLKQHYMLKKRAVRKSNETKS